MNQNPPQDYQTTAERAEDAAFEKAIAAEIAATAARMRQGPSVSAELIDFLFPRVPRPESAPCSTGNMVETVLIPVGHGGYIALTPLPGIRRPVPQPRPRMARPGAAPVCWMVHIRHGRFTINTQDGPMEFRLPAAGLPPQCNGIARILPELPTVAEVHTYQEGRLMALAGLATAQC